MSNEFLVDTIYNHEYLKKVLGLIKSIKKNDKFDYIEKINEQFNIKDDEEIYNKFFSELENINKNGIVNINNRRRNPNCINKYPSNYYNNNVGCCNHPNHQCSGNHPIIPEYDKDAHSDLSNNSEDINEFDIDSFDSSCEKKAKEKRIYVDGIFDLSHSGHFNAMRQAKKLGDVVVVGINSDEDALNSKGVSPIYTQDERGALVAGCKWVDEVIIGTKYNVDMELLKKYNCDYAAHGSDIAYDRNGVCCYEDVQKNNRLKVFERSYGISTTTIVNHLLQIVSNANKIGSPQTHNLKSNSLLDVKDEEKNKNCDTNSMANTENVADNINSTEDKINLKIPKSDSYDVDSNNTKVAKGDKKKNSDVSSNTKVIISKNKGYIAASQIYLFMEKHEKKKHHKVVYVDGSFDMFHLGHLKMIENARKLGDYLLVGVYSDETVRKLKGSHFPVTSVLERTLTVLAMKGVDDVVICAPWVITESFIKRFQIDTVVRGSIADYNYSNFGPDPYTVPKKLNIFKEIPSESDMTTCEIINRIEKNKQYLLSIISARKKKEENIWKNNNSYNIK
ncbi:ethanolamine-phosphate cytidylyltransferase, putative [Plasmodium vinckei]|uniref:ethanolamine-phosphate cytidylyltransferase n=2 Tax=Plasmodium vinckei TaxID=5860 RepID=W7AT29_PLAVN|nr:ethanolamine-phosphate cytidylyltransferase [Plasmodium vinckei petteri]CAD2098231.1 ethanolamine-phosphate cytidylyltransferase, putative [Plasmodium vinckei petteri]CAD2098594.1 ethanolamine-phosphate cytidylyltransferase, putative [Plasmodium vinckei]